MRYDKLFLARIELVMKLLRLKELRLNKGLTREKLARDTALSLSTYSGYENGSRLPNLETVKRLAVYFQVSVDYLIGFTDNPDPYPGEDTHLIHPGERRFVQGFRKLQPEDQRLFQELMDRFPKHEKE